jgi:E3 ubiquitin-protein ligase SIAH1
MEVKSNGTKKEGDAPQDGEGIVKKQSVTMAMELNTRSIREEGEAPQEKGGTCKKLNVTMAMDVFDCSICSQPLRPPIFQVSASRGCTSLLLN